MKKEPTEEQRQMQDTLDFFESLLTNNAIDSARSYMLNLIVALYNGYNAVTSYNTMAMYKMVKDMGVKLKQPIILLNTESQRRLTLLANLYDWTKMDVRFLEDFCENILKIDQTVKIEKSEIINSDLQKLMLKEIWGISNSK